MAWRFTSLAAVVLVGACRPAPATKADTGSSGADGPSECTPGTPPEITAFSVEEGEPTADGPTLFVRVSATDEDGDLVAYQVNLWFDATVDGSVVASSDNLIAPDPVSLDAAPCGAPEISSEIEIVLLGDDVLAYDTLYEFAAVLSDASGLESQTVITTAKTPTEN